VINNVALVSGVVALFFAPAEGVSVIAGIWGAIGDCSVYSQTGNSTDGGVCFMDWFLVGTGPLKKFIPEGVKRVVYQLTGLGSGAANNWVAGTSG